jgi:preprotein translocase subunit Sec63
MPSPDFDAYAVLGVARNATADQIKAAYRDLAGKYHPDHHQGNPLEDLAAAKLADINRAYEILSDPQRRAAYDASPPARPRPVATPLDATGSGRKRIRWLGLLGLLLFLPLLVRLVIFVVRMLTRVGSEGFAAVRGTPLLLALVVIVITAAIVMLVRRRKR